MQKYNMIEDLHQFGQVCKNNPVFLVIPLIYLLRRTATVMFSSLSVCLSVSVCPSVRPSVRLSVYLSVCLLAISQETDEWISWNFQDRWNLVQDILQHFWNVPFAYKHIFSHFSWEPTSVSNITKTLVNWFSRFFQCRADMRQGTYWHILRMLWVTL